MIDRQPFVGKALANTVTWRHVWSFKSKWMKTKSKFKVSSLVAAVTFWELSNCHYCRWLVTAMLKGRHRTFLPPYKAQLACPPLESSFQNCYLPQPTHLALTSKGHVPQNDSPHRFMWYQSYNPFSTAADNGWPRAGRSDGLGVLSPILLRRRGIELSS